MNFSGFHYQTFAKLLIISSYFLMEVLIKTKIIRKHSARGIEEVLPDHCFFVTTASFYTSVVINSRLLAISLLNSKSFSDVLATTGQFLS